MSGYCEDCAGNGTCYGCMSRKLAESEARRAEAERLADGWRDAHERAGGAMAMAKDQTSRALTQRDAALQRAEEAEREARRHLDNSLAAGDIIESRTAERDAARASLAAAVEVLREIIQAQDAANNCDPDNECYTDCRELPVAAIERARALASVLGGGR